MPRTVESTFAEELFQPSPAERAAQFNCGKIAACRAACTDPFLPATTWVTEMASRCVSSIRAAAWLAALTLGLGLGAATSADAAIFSDNFNAENGGDGALNYTGFANWTVSDGTVDLLGAGGGYNPIPGNGAYVDMDGSSGIGAFPGNAGIMTLTSPIALGAGSYTLKFDLAGSQRGGTETVRLELFGLAAPFVQDFTLPSGAPFTAFTVPFTAVTPVNFRMSFEGISNDNVGMLLDNVVLDSVGGQAAVPEPASLTLWGLGALGCAIHAYRRKRAALFFPPGLDARHLPSVGVA